MPNPKLKKHAKSVKFFRYANIRISADIHRIRTTSVYKAMALIRNRRDLLAVKLVIQRTPRVAGRASLAETILAEA